MALLEFVRSGKGFAGCHCAADTLYEWPEYGELIGAYLGKNLGTKDLTVRLDDLAHPSTRDLDTAFRVHDELYQFKAPFARDKLHVLMHCDQPGVANGGASRGQKTSATAACFTPRWDTISGRGKTRGSRDTYSEDSVRYSVSSYRWTRLRRPRDSQF